MTAPLNEEQGIDFIAEAVERAGARQAGQAPFALVLGAGFSHGLVPMTREIVGTHIPLWVKARRQLHGYRELLGPTTTDARRAEISKDFWRDFNRRGDNADEELELDARGLPIDAGAAYRAAFAPDSWVLGTPDATRAFQRALMQWDRRRLNAAHFLLASILGAQTRVGSDHDATRFNYAGAFSRLILTTNFDPFLQMALQAVGCLYLMSDQPELLEPGSVDNESDAIHLVYVHGTIHRRSQMASAEEIQAVKARNAERLAHLLKGRAVIVIGYSGWDDAVLEALIECKTFDRGLFWCGREAAPLANVAPDSPLRQVLGAARYIRIGGADQFMAGLCAKLLPALPSLIENPIRQVREMLEQTDLKKLGMLDRVPRGGGLVISRPDPHVFKNALEETVARLKEAEGAFPAPSPLSRAGLKAALGSLPEALEICTSGLAGAGERDTVELRLLRGSVEYKLNNLQNAIDDFTWVIKSGAGREHVLTALERRALTLRSKKQPDVAKQDYCSIIERRDAGIEWVAKARCDRADVTVGQIEQTAWKRDRPEFEVMFQDACSDYSQVIEDSTAPVDARARASTNKGYCMVRAGEFEAALVDLNRVITDMPDAAVEHRAVALYHRAWIHLKSAPDKFLDDIRTLLVLDVSVPMAVFDEGLGLLVCGNPREALAAYERSVERFGDRFDVVEGAIFNLANWAPQDDRFAPMAALMAVLPPRRREKVERDLARATVPGPIASR